MYTHEEGELVPSLGEGNGASKDVPSLEETHQIPIRIVNQKSETSFDVVGARDAGPGDARTKRRISGKTIQNIVFSGIALTIIIVVGITGLNSFQKDSLYAASSESIGNAKGPLLIAVRQSIEYVGVRLEDFFAPEIVYLRKE